MTSSNIPSAAWSRRLNDMLEFPGTKPPATLGMLLNNLGVATRFQRYNNRLKKQGRAPIVDFINAPDPGPTMGAPLGGLGGGTITRGWRGEFNRWAVQAGRYHWGMVTADQFSLYVDRPGQRGRAVVLFPGEPDDGGLAGWAWNRIGAKSTYHALYPRAWTEYNEPDPELKVTCRQISPVIPHNYEDSTLPAGVFVYTLENSGDTPAEVGLMLTWQNGTGTENDRAGGHFNTLFNDGNITGIELHHKHRQIKAVGEGKLPDEPEYFEDPLTFAIAAQGSDDVEVTYRARFVTTSSGMDVWTDFNLNGRLENIEDDKPAQERRAIGAALAATVTVPPGETRELVFSLAWDMPIARFGLGRGWYRRYTQQYGRDGQAAAQIAAEAIRQYPAWEEAIEAWQQPILADGDLPDWYKSALFNGLYALVDNGTIWTAGEEGQDPPPSDDPGKFAYLESHEYLMYNTYDVHFYASFALAMLWPELELSLQRDFVDAVATEYDEEWKTLLRGKVAPRKVRGVLPHDLGGPTEDPWYKINIYNLEDIARWKDLNPKFVLQIYRDYILTQEKTFLEQAWPAVKEAIETSLQFDVDEDGLIENEGYPDQTYDTWSVAGPSAYTGGLWLACLQAGAAMADLMGEADLAAQYRATLEQGQQSYEELLWNGEYYDYDSSRQRQRDSIMADQMAGQWYAKACGLPGIVPDEHAKLALKRVFDTNVMQYEQGELGAVNGMRPDGRVDTTSMQSKEVWTGTTFAVAAAMLQEGLIEEAFQTAKGIYTGAYEELGYWFNLPEAWELPGYHRSLGYMRPLAIWAMQWAWERRHKDN